ncbi:hypothetical protein, partial [Escherichia coli]|uniref:hypothetical protein n=1 Tax=Escherichia coli TaxID=562 RepID=UPI001BC8F43A
FSDPGPVFHTIVSIKNDGHYFCRAGGNRPDGLNEPVTLQVHPVPPVFDTKHVSQTRNFAYPHLTARDFPIRLQPLMS